MFNWNNSLILSNPTETGQLKWVWDNFTRVISAQCDKVFKEYQMMKGHHGKNGNVTSEIPSPYGDERRNPVLQAWQTHLFPFWENFLFLF